MRTQRENTLGYTGKRGVRAYLVRAMSGSRQRDDGSVEETPRRNLCNQRSNGVKVAFSIGCLSDKPARCVCAREAWPLSVCGNTVDRKRRKRCLLFFPCRVERAVVAGRWEGKIPLGETAREKFAGVTKRNLSDCWEVGFAQKYYLQVQVGVTSTGHFTAKRGANDTKPNTRTTQAALKNEDGGW